MFGNIEQDFDINVRDKTNPLSIAFERNNRIQKNASGEDYIQLDGRSSMLVIDWVRKFKYILFCNMYTVSFHICQDSRIR